MNGSSEIRGPVQTFSLNSKRSEENKQAQSCYKAAAIALLVIAAVAIAAGVTAAVGQYHFHATFGKIGGIALAVGGGALTLIALAILLCKKPEKKEITVTDQYNVVVPKGYRYVEQLPDVVESGVMQFTLEQKDSHIHIAWKTSGANNGLLIIRPNDWKTNDGHQIFNLEGETLHLISEGFKGAVESSWENVEKKDGDSTPPVETQVAPPTVNPEAAKTEEQGTGWGFNIFSSPPKAPEGDSPSTPQLPAVEEGKEEPAA